MTKLLAGLLIGVFATAATALDESTVTVHHGTVVAVTIEQGLTTVAKAKKAAEKGMRQVKAGDLVAGRVIDDVKVAGKTVIASGAAVTFRVGSETKKNRRMGRKGILVLEPMVVAAVSGDQIALEGTIDSTGSGRIGTTVGLTYAFGPLGLLKKGKPAEIPAGGMYHVLTRGTIEVVVP